MIVVIIILYDGESEAKGRRAHTGPSEPGADAQACSVLTLS